MKKVLFTALLTLSTFVNHVANSAADTIRFASSATYPPFEYYDANNQIVGFDIDLAKALCTEIKAECTFTNQAFDSLIAALKFRRYDAVISGMDITEERSKQVLFTKPYYANSAVFIGKKGQYKSISDLYGKRVGMENGTTHQKYIHDKEPKIETVSYESYQTAIIDLKNGRLDAVFGDTAVVNEWLKESPELAAIGDTVTDAVYFGTGMGIAVRAGNTELADEFNTALDTIKANGVYQTIHDKWFTKAE